MHSKPFSRVWGMAAVVLGLTLGAGKVLALNVLTFDTGDAERNSTVGGLGFSMTQVGAGGVADLDFSMYDVIYIAQSYEELLSSSLLGALGGRSADLVSFVANGGGLVFGSPAIGGGVNSGLTATVPNPITNGVDLSTLLLSGLPPLGFPVAVDNGQSAILAGGLGDGRLVGWNPGEGPGETTPDALALVENSINWAGGQVPAVPEPGTLALFGLGAAGLLLVRRRKRVKA